MPVKPKPRALSYKEQLRALLNYVVKRQLQGRPTTMRQVSKRMSQGSAYVQGLLERANIQYTLVSYAGTPKTDLGNIEIFLISMPEKLAEEMGVDLEALTYAYNRAVKEETEALQREEEVSYKARPSKEELEELDSIDPYARYRLSKEQYIALKPHLISFEELEREARARGYKTTAIRRATGGDRMRYPLAGPLWRPYVVGKKRYYLKKVLSNLDQSDKMYVHPSVAKRRKKERAKQEEAKKFLDFGGRERRIDSVRRSAKRAMKRVHRKAGINEVVEIE